MAALPEDPNSIPSTHTVAHNCLQLHLQGIMHMHTPLHMSPHPQIYINKK